MVILYGHGKVSGNFINFSRFARDKQSKLEWANVVAAPHDLMCGATGYVFERLL